MRERICGFFALVLLIGAFAWAGSAQEKVEPLLAPMFVPGKQYIVVVDCLPAAVVQSPAFPCYAELLTVRSIRSDNGWVITTTAQGEEWTINPARVYAVTPAQGDSIRAMARCPDFASVTPSIGTPWMAHCEDGKWVFRRLVRGDSGRVVQPHGIP